MLHTHIPDQRAWHVLGTYSAIGPRMHFSLTRLRDPLPSGFALYGIRIITTDPLSRRQLIELSVTQERSSSLDLLQCAVQLKRRRDKNHVSGNMRSRETGKRKYGNGKVKNETRIRGNGRRNFAFGGKWTSLFLWRHVRSCDVIRLLSQSTSQTHLATESMWIEHSRTWHTPVTSRKTLAVSRQSTSSLYQENGLQNDQIGCNSLLIQSYTRTQVIALHIIHYWVPL